MDDMMRPHETAHDTPVDMSESLTNGTNPSPARSDGSARVTRPVSTSDDAGQPQDQPAAEVPLVGAWLTADEPTIADDPRTMPLRSAQGGQARWPWGASRLRERVARQSSSGNKRGPRRGIWIALALLLILALPAVVAISSAAHDYITLKNEGQDGIARLMAVPGDLTGRPTSLGSGGSASSLSSLTGGSGKSAQIMAMLQALMATPGPDVNNPAYTYLVQRQGGTLYPLKVTIQPAKGVAAEGSATLNTQTTIASDTYLALGGTPKPTPTATPDASATATTATPAATPGATPTGGASSGSSSGGLSGSLPDPARIAAAQRDLRAAQSDFQALADQVSHPDWVLALAGMIPMGGSDLRAAQSLAQVGIDVTQAGLALLDAATPLLTRLHGAKSLLSGATKLLTQSDVTALQEGMTVAARSLEDATQRLGTIDVQSLPLSAHQKALFAELTPLLPQVNALLPQASAYVGLAGWLLGADAPRNFLVQTLDRGEMRATGGFTGQYGILTLDGGKLAPFSLQDVNCLDYLTGCLSNGWIFGRRPPAPYNSWWPFGNWGLRDSNLSADFPTDAKLVTDVYYHESGQKVDGLIDVSPLAIEDVLRVTGPIQVPLYNETITADNLEAKLHYYQQDPAAIAKEKQLSAGDNSTSSRKRFTQLVGQLLQERVKSMPVSELIPLAKEMLQAMRDRDLEVYFANPQAQQLLAQLHVDGTVNTTPGVDGFMLVQSNVSVSKATSFVKMTQQDVVTLDSKGGATHHLTLTFSANYTYNQVYGYLTYRDYLRIYTPPDAKLLGGDGWDTGKPLCWAPYGSVTQEPAQFASASVPVPVCTGNPYRSDELSCPSGNFAPGPESPNEFGSDGQTPWVSDVLGSPPNTHSDLANRAMFAGYVVVPDYCTATVKLSWYSPHVAPAA